MLKQINKFLACLGIVFFSLGYAPVFALLSCSITTAAACTDTILLRMSSATNAHAELPTQSSGAYANNVICCSGLSGTACSGNFARVLRLSTTTNAHVEIATNSNYGTSTCMSSASEIPIIGYQDTNCTGFDTTLASISSTTNATIGNASNYTKKVCGSLVPASLTFSISTSTVYLGEASSAITRYGSSTNISGSDTEVVAHTLLVTTNAVNGYTLTAKGATLTSGTTSIAAIGGTSTTTQIGVEQFGIRLTASGGLGVVSSPYQSALYAFGATASSSSQVATASVGDNATTTYSVRYMTNIAPTTMPSNYTTNIVYIATANY